MPAPLLFLLSGLTQYVGAAVAVRLFGTLSPTTVAWLRISVAAVLLLAWARPWRAPLRGRHLATAAAFGVVLAAMNVSFYLAIAHLPLGTAVAVEFLGPVTIAAITGRGWRDRTAIGVALVGVVLLAGVSLRMGPGARVGLVAILAAAGANLRKLLRLLPCAVRIQWIRLLQMVLAAFDQPMSLSVAA